MKISFFIFQELNLDNQNAAILLVVCYYDSLLMTLAAGPHLAWSLVIRTSAPTEVSVTPMDGPEHNQLLHASNSRDMKTDTYEESVGPRIDRWSYLFL